jgi:hypothetical protein
MDEKTISINQASPCGIVCTICMGFLRTKNSCPGCRFEGRYKSKSCIACRIKNCDELVNNGFTYCYECSKFPCAWMKHLDNRYRKNYAFSMIENLLYLKEKGPEKFIQNERKRWTCTECGGIISVHRGYCTGCGKVFYVHTGTNRAPIK